MKLPLVSFAAAAAILFSGCGGSSPSGTIPASASASAPSLESDGAHSAAAAYCKQTHGQVEIRQPVYGSNGSSLLFLSGERPFCQYTSKKDGSRIHILLGTLYTKLPTLAALAYILKPPMGSCKGNPASCYCSYLGGSDQFGGTTGAGGGWYLKTAIDQTLEACIFPDMSTIDSWGLAYHANGIIRGTDLRKVMRYKYPGKV